MAKLGNVRQLNPKTAKLNPYETIFTFLEEKGQNSINTKKTYERSIRDFFRTMRNKELKDLNPEDLIFTKNQIKSYRVQLKNIYKGSTVNNAITAIKECYKELEDDGFDVHYSWFDVGRYNEKDSESWDSLTHSEIIEILTLLLPTRKGKEKALLVRLAYATAFRKTSLLTMKWDQIELIDGIYFVRVIGKGDKLSYKKISDELYEELMAHKANQKEGTEKIFQLTDKTIDRMMSFIVENMDFGTRRIVFHSFKNASIDEIALITNFDLKAMQQHGDHEDASTTLNSYVKKKNREDLVTVDINFKVPVEKLDELSHEELLALIKSVDRSTMIKVLKTGNLM